ncbi:insulinase family protein [Marinifilum sp. N1E240]|uniref:M16 family metallopeptidase n=1 Tax=Marinifilum sp. N1E240 TaxID=2608082 RepID=UPI00128D8D1A|nr:pitrilysin family protein [Marinifilum sp. N1E240]MPQ47335.1 insulinase family protein [Marinifilum sp. N1E240]
MKNLYRLFALLIAVCFVISASAQVDRTKAPAAGPAPKVQLGDYDTFTLKNGMKVLVVANHKLPQVGFAISLLNDPIAEGDKAGYLSVMGQLLDRGTTKRSGKQIAEEIDFIGAELGVSSSGVDAGGLSRYKEKIIELMADVLQNPTFPQEEFDKIVKQTLSGLEANKTDPNSMASNMRSRVLYPANHPYGDVVTEETVKSFTVEDCKKYYTTYFKPNKALMAIVGDITTKEAKKLVKKYFGDWESAEVPNHKYEMPAKMEGKRVVLSNKDAALQSLVRIYNSFELKKGNADVIPASVMNAMLGRGFSGLLMKNLREDKAYTYGAGSRLYSDKLVGGFYTSSEVKAEVTDSALMQMVVEMDRIRDTKLTQDHLNMTKATMAGDFARSLEDPGTIARFAMAIERYNLPEDYYATYLEKLDKVTLEDIQAMAKKYVDPNNAVYLVVGDKKYKKQLAKLSSTGKVEEYDYKGDIVKEDPNAIPEGLTCKTVIANYVDAIGGRDNWMAVKDLSIKGEMKMGPMSINVESAQKNNEKFCMKMTMNGQVMQAMYYNGTSGRVVAQGNEMVANEAQLAGFKQQAQMCPELNMEKLGYSMKIVGAENVDGEKAYKLEVKDSQGNTKYEFFSADSGLKLKTIAQQQGMSVTTLYKNYTEVEGIKYPYSAITKMGPQEMPLTITELSVNKGVDDSVFN